jgi:predicted nucleotidyltransferase
MTAAVKAMSFVRYPMNDILAGPGSVRVLRALMAHGGALSVSRLAAETRLTPNGSRGVLHDLERAGIVESIGDGRTRLFRIAVDHPLTAALDVLFTAEGKWLDEILAAVKAATADERIVSAWLFGSVARAEDTKESDFDIAIVITGDPAHTDSIADGVRDAVMKTGKRLRFAPSIISLHVNDVQRLAQEDAPLWTDLLRDAQPIKGPRPKMMRDRAARADMGAVLAILEKVPDVPPEPGDEIPEDEVTLA